MYITFMYTYIWIVEILEIYINSEEESAKYP